MAAVSPPATLLSFQKTGAHSIRQWESPKATTPGSETGWRYGSIKRRVPPRIRLAT